jgi:uncharacterized protein YyaL (SSP411 family)
MDKKNHEAQKCFFLFLLFLFFSSCTQSEKTITKNVSPMGLESQAMGIRWRGWSDSLFEQAKKENRFVLLDLEAVWCHWCHVMDEKTYKDPAVLSLIQSRYIPVKVDQDSRPDLSNRYEDYGWPATIIFNVDKGEIVKRSGYIPPEEMVSLLQAIIKDPTSGPSVVPEKQIISTNTFSLSGAFRKELNDLFIKQYDFQKGGWGFIHKYLDADSVEYALVLAEEGNVQAKKMAKQTLSAELKLMDPVWDGVYQYSTHGDWDHPHFEKIMSMQADNIKIYAEAYSLWQNPLYLKAAQDIRRYLKKFLTSPEGPFYTSQDADIVQGEHSGDYFALKDAERRKRGVPQIDTHLYSRENGWAINALATLYRVNPDAETLEQATRSAEWILKNRSLRGGGFSHDASDPAGPYLGDTLAMGRAFLNLYAITAERKWLKHAEEAARFMAKYFKGSREEGAGFLTAVASKESSWKPRPLRDENIVLARFANLLFHYTGNSFYREMAEHAMCYWVIPEVTKKGFPAGVLLADRELSKDPLHITIVGHKDDPLAKKMFLASLHYPSFYRRIEWWDKREGPMPNPDVQYPELNTAAAFVCTQNRCSLPIREPEKIAEIIEQLQQEKN